MKKYLIVAMLAAIALPQTASAEPVTHRVVVQHKDLDLRADAGVKTLENRVRRAVIEACGSAPVYDQRGKQDVRKCRASMYRQASAKIARLIARASEARPVRTAAIGN
jgi:UrcA family protein